MTKSEAIKFLYKKLGHAYCDNCKGLEEEEFERCDGCERKYQNWGLSLSTATDIVDKILGDE